MKTADDLFQSIAPHLDRVLAVFDAELHSDFLFVNELANHVRRYRGKLLRPKLVLMTGAACGGLKPEHVTIAAVVEMVHMATLVHDDVLDEADARRGGGTVNRLHGNEAAVMLGDYLISHAYHLCSGLGSPNYSRRIAAVTNTVCEGELMQIHHRGDLDLGEAEYLEIIGRKTAALTSVCCELGATASGASEAQVRRLAEFGRDLGIAFQIVDDILDVTGTPGETGKSVGRDAALGKMTLPGIRFLSRHPERRKEIVDAMHGTAKAGFGRLAELLRGADAVEEAMETARAYVQSAVGHLAGLPQGEARESLQAAAEFVVHRRH